MVVGATVGAEDTNLSRCRAGWSQFLIPRTRLRYKREHVTRKPLRKTVRTWSRKILQGFDKWTWRLCRSTLLKSHSKSESFRKKVLSIGVDMRISEKKYLKFFENFLIYVYAKRALWSTGNTNFDYVCVDLKKRLRWVKSHVLKISDTFLWTEHSYFANQQNRKSILEERWISFERALLFDKLYIKKISLYLSSTWYIRIAKMNWVTWFRA